VVVGLPVADAGTCEELGAIADKIVCLRTPRPVRSIVEWYDDFTLVSDDDVRRLLAEARTRAPVADVGLVRELRGMADDYDVIVGAGGAGRLRPSPARRRTAWTSSTRARRDHEAPHRHTRPRAARAHGRL
jgi:hypothetical protein